MVTSKEEVLMGGERECLKERPALSALAPPPFPNFDEAENWK